MALRRLAQENNVATNSPKARNGEQDSLGLPFASRSLRYRSPASNASLSATIPFDWEAARAQRPPPLSTPSKSRKSLVNGANVNSPIRRAVIRKKNILEKIVSVPSWVAFQFALFPNNLPLPSHNTSAWVLGGFLHVVSLSARVCQLRQVPDSDLGWEDLYREREDEAWFDWTWPALFLVFMTSCLNVVYLFTRIKVYRMHLRKDPVASPNSRFASSNLDSESPLPPSVLQRLKYVVWKATSFSSRWFFNSKSSPALSGKPAQVQELLVWSPGDLEMSLFSIYSPAHAILWMATGSTNWISTSLVMFIVGVQLRALIESHKALLKDKEIIAAEVLNEYNHVFVYPRVLPVRKDVSTMTDESEMVNVWED